MAPEQRRAATVVALVLLAVVVPAVAASVPGTGTSAPDSLATDAPRSTDLRAGGSPAGRATNGLALFSLDPAVVEAPPGGEVTVAVVLRSSPQIASGAYKAGFVLRFNASVLRASEASEGPFMGMRRNTTVRTNQSAVDNQRGFLLYELVRDPPNGGVSGAATFAYVTFEVRADAPEGSYPVTFYRTLVLLTDENLQQVSTRGGEVVVNRTAAEVATEPPGGTATATATAGGTPGGGPGAVVGVAALLGTLGLLAGVLVLVRQA